MLNMFYLLTPLICFQVNRFVVFMAKPWSVGINGSREASFRSSSFLSIDKDCTSAAICSVGLPPLMIPLTLSSCNVPRRRVL